MDEIKKTLGKTFRGQTDTVKIWGGLITVSIVIYFLFSSGDFSFLLTYSSFMRCFGLCLINYRMWNSKTASGISVKTLELYAIVFGCRLLSIMRHQGYLPYDKSGDWFYHFIEIVSMGATCLAIYGIFGPLISTYDEKFDKFGHAHIPNEFGIAYIAGPCILLAIIFHPSLNREFFSDTCWTISMYVEAAAMFPQLYMFQKQAGDTGGKVETLTGHTVFALAFARVFELIFWAGSFSELKGFSGYLILLSQLLHLAIMADFFYYYFVSLTKGLPMELPTTQSLV